MNIPDLQEYLEQLQTQLKHGCGDGACVIKRPISGQHTNGVCNCHPKNIARILKYLADSVSANKTNKWEK